MSTLPQAVRQTRERLTALVRGIDPRAASFVETRRGGAASVVVVGETNRGKSSLVNALLATPNLSPVDAEVATATYLVFRHGAEWSARACYAGSTPPVPFDRSELVDWVSAAHDLPEGMLPPRYVEVDAPIPLLERLSVVDTPGVGGLESAHGELAAEAAASATALLFVVDASAPFTRGELDFLATVGERVETVVFALTKVDQYRGWRTVLEADQALLAEHAPRFAGATFHPVSSRMFELAGKAPNPDAAAMLRERSGIGALQAALQELVVGRAAMLGEANALRALATVLDELVARGEADQRALSAGEEEAEALRARRDELNAQRRSSTRSWQVRLRGEVQRARVEGAHEVSRQMRDVQTWFRTAIETASPERLAALPHEVDAALQVVSGRISGGLGARLARVADAALADLFAPDELAVIRGQFARGATPPIVLRPPEKRAPTAEDKLLVFMGVSGGLGAGRLAAMPLAGLGVAALNPVVLPVTIVLGLGAGWWMARTRKHSADKQHLKQWLSDAIADARSTVDQLVAEQLIEAEQQLSLALDDALGRRVDAIEAELREVDRALRMEAGERAKELGRATRRLAELKSGRAKVDELLSRIRALRDRA
ncbi:dynamin family protein [Saccharothrix australiensis]|uniref:Dynamin family protein n=1 Tax=Saccharothrix australiensis TaxID=2072 RepID=A0A495VVR6_9PSEU|nr:dynamin family protein [Saccharothrix australiensis]RKT51728.1 dynamin family protein [Saccharothrix australiensis]